MTSDPAYEAISKAKRQVESGNPQGAVSTLEGYLKTDPHNTKPRLQLAQIIIYELDDLNYGMMQLDIILDLEPDNTEALKAAVTILSKYKKYNKETDEKFARLLELEPTADTYNLYAKFLRNQLTDFKRAAEYYEKAIALAPDRYEFHQNYAVLLLNDIRDYEKARAELERTMELNPGNANVKKNYDRLMRERFDKDGNLKKKGLARFRHRCAFECMYKNSTPLVKPIYVYSINFSEVKSWN